MCNVHRTAEFDKWLKGLRDERARATIARRLTRLEDGNLGDVEPAGGEVSELRVHYGPGYRACFVRRESVVLALLGGGGGGDKSSQDRDVKRAVAIAKEV